MESMYSADADAFMILSLNQAQQRIHQIFTRNVLIGFSSPVDRR